MNPECLPGDVVLEGYDLDLALRSVGPGWRGLVERVFAAKPEWLRVVQVKEKFAGLRVYSSLGPVRADAIGLGSFPVPDSRPTGIDDLTQAQRERVLEFEELIRQVEAESLFVCEECGAKGHIRTHPWLVTLCDVCDTSKHAEDEFLEGPGGSTCGVP
jgi:hypothetical protein